MLYQYLFALALALAPLGVWAAPGESLSSPLFLGMGNTGPDGSLLVSGPADAVEIPRSDGSVDVAELWRRSAEAGDGIEIPRSDGSVDVAELW